MEGHPGSDVTLSTCTGLRWADTYPIRDPPLTSFPVLLNSVKLHEDPDLSKGQFNYIVWSSGVSGDLPLFLTRFSRRSVLIMKEWDCLHSLTLTRTFAVRQKWRLRREWFSCNSFSQNITVITLFEMVDFHSGKERHGYMGFTTQNVSISLKSQHFMFRSLFQHHINLSLWLAHRSPLTKKTHATRPKQISAVFLAVFE